MRARGAELLVTGASLEPAKRPLVRICKPRHEVFRECQFVARRFVFLCVRSEIRNETGIILQNVLSIKISRTVLPGWDPD